jgi:DNA-binding beta-propeller fold protein YncE
MAYVADEGQDAIHIVALPSGTNTGHINLSIQPYALAYATPLPLPNADLLVVVGHNGGGAPQLAVVSLALKQTLRTIGLGDNDPQDVAIAPGSFTAYVSTDNNAVLAVNILTGQTSTVALTGPSYGVAVRPDGSEIFATQQGDDYGLTRFAPNASAPDGVTPTGFGPWGVALTTNAARAVVVNDGDNSLTVIGTRTHVRIGDIDLDPLDSDDPTSIAVAPPVANPPPVTPPPGSPPPGTPPPTAIAPSTVPHLPTTGGPLTALGVVALVLLGAAALARRA